MAPEKLKNPMRLTPYLWPGPQDFVRDGVAFTAAENKNDGPLNLGMPTPLKRRDYSRLWHKLRKPRRELYRVHRILRRNPG